MPLNTQVKNWETAGKVLFPSGLGRGSWEPTGLATLRCMAQAPGTAWPGPATTAALFPEIKVISERDEENLGF